MVDRFQVSTILASVVIFLPVFIFSMTLEIKLRGLASLSEGFFFHFSSGLLLYVSLIIPILIGALICEIGRMIFCRYIKNSICVILFSPFVWFLAYLIPDFGGEFFIQYFLSTIIATILFSVFLISVGNKVHIKENN